MKTAKLLAAVALAIMLLGAAKDKHPKVAKCVGPDGGKFTLPKLVKRSINVDYTVQYYPENGRVEYCNSFDCFAVPLGTQVYLQGAVVPSDITTRCE